MEEVVAYVFESGTIDAATRKATVGLRNIALALIPLFFILTQGWNFISTAVSNVSKGRAGIFSLEELIRAAVLWLLIIVYIPTMGWVADLAGVINRNTTADSYEAVQGKEIFDDYLTQQMSANTEDEESDFWTLSIQFLTDAGQSIMNAVSGILNGLTLTILSIIRFVVEGIAIYMAKLFYAIGPIVVAFSVLPPFKDKLDRWFGVYITVLLVPTTLNTLDYLVYASLEATSTITLSTNPIADLVFGITIIVMYLLSFWVTSFIVGSSEAGKVLSTAAALATTAVGGAVAGKLGGGASGGSGSAAADAAGSAKGVIEG